MSTLHNRRYCRDCGRKTMHLRDSFSGGIGCLLTVITAGLFLPVWILILILEAFKPWLCQNCGHKRMT